MGGKRNRGEIWGDGSSIPKVVFTSQELASRLTVWRGVGD